MASTNISLKKEAYEALNSLRRKNESFSEVILDLAKNKKGINGKDLIEMTKNKSNKKTWNEIEKNTKNFRKDMEKRFDNTAKQMEKANDRSGHMRNS